MSGENQADRSIKLEPKMPRGITMPRGNRFISTVARIGTMLALGACVPGSVATPGSSPTDEPLATARIVEVTQTQASSATANPTETATFVPSKIPESTTEACVDPNQVLFTEGLTPDTQTVPVLSTAGFEDETKETLDTIRDPYSGNKANKDLYAGITSQVVSEIHSLGQVKAEGINSVFIPEYLDKSEITKLLAVLGDTNLPFHISSYQGPESVTNQNALLLAPHMNGNGWVVEPWTGIKSIKTRPDGSFRIDGTLEAFVIDKDINGNVVKVSLYSVPSQNSGNAHADVAIVSGCLPSDVLVDVDETKVLGVLRLDANMVDPATLADTWTENSTLAVGESTATPDVTATVVSTLTPVEAVGETFWAALKTHKGDKLGSYIEWSQRDDAWNFSYAVDGTSLSNIPIPGVPGVTADMAVRAYYFDSSGNEQSILVAMVLKFPDGTYAHTGDLNTVLTQDKLSQYLQQYPDSFQIGTLGELPDSFINLDSAYIIKVTGSRASLPGWKAYLQYLQANLTNLQEFTKTGSPTLNIIIPTGLDSVVGEQNIFN